MRTANPIALLAWSIPVGILAQFTLAGLSLFQDGSLWGGHAVFGLSLLLPIGVVAGHAFLRKGSMRLRSWSGMLVAASAAQVALGVTIEQAGPGMVPALHVANAGLVLLCACGLAFAQGTTATASYARA